MSYTKAQLLTALREVSESTVDAYLAAGVSLPTLIGRVFEVGFMKYLKGEITLSEESIGILVEAMDDLEKCCFNFVEE